MHIITLELLLRLFGVQHFSFTVSPDKGLFPWLHKIEGFKKQTVCIARQC